MAQGRNIRRRMLDTSDRAGAAARAPGKGRMDGFSGGVFGFAITLLLATVLPARPVECVAHGRFARPR